MKFSVVEKHIKDCSKVKTLELVQIYLNNLNKITIITNLLAFFLLLFKNCFLSPGSGSRRENTQMEKCSNQIKYRYIKVGTNF